MPLSCFLYTIYFIPFTPIITVIIIIAGIAGVVILTIYHCARENIELEMQIDNKWINNDANQTYTLEEFEIINDQLTTHTLEVNGEPINHFELNAKGNLIPVPQTTHFMEVTITEIARQLGCWNIYSRQNGDIKTSP